MCIARPEILDKWFSSLYPWLKRCEEEFGFHKLKGCDNSSSFMHIYLKDIYFYWFA